MTRISRRRCSTTKFCCSDSDLKDCTPQFSQFFLDNALLDFLEAYGKAEVSELRTYLLEMAVFLLFSLGNLLRIFAQPLESVVATAKSLQYLFSALQKAAGDQNTTEAVLRLVHELFAAYASRLRYNSGELFTPRGASISSRSAEETYIQQQLRHAIFAYLQAAIALLALSTRNYTKHLSSTACCMNAMLKHLEGNNHYVAGPGDVNREWFGVLQSATSFLSSVLAAEGGEAEAIHGLCVIERIDFTAIEEEFPRLLSTIADRPSTHNEVLICGAIEYYGKTRQLPHFIEKLEEAVTSTMNNAIVARLVFIGPLLSLFTRRALTKECSTSLGPTQTCLVVDHLLKACQSHLEQALSRSTEKLEEPPSKKKRRTSQAAIVANESLVLQELAAAKFQAVSQHLVAVLRSQEELSGDTAEIILQTSKIVIRGLESIQKENEASIPSPSQRCAAVCLQLARATRHILPIGVMALSTKSMLAVLEPRKKGEILHSILRLELVFTALMHYLRPMLRFPVKTVSVKPFSSKIGDRTYYSRPLIAYWVFWTLPTSTIGPATYTTLTAAPYPSHYGSCSVSSECMSLSKQIPPLIHIHTY